MIFLKLGIEFNLVVWMNKWERMLISEEAVDCESGLIADTQPTLAEHVQRLRLGGK